MADTRRAGMLIISDIALFNEAAILLDREIQPEALKELNAKIEAWANEKKWKGEFGWDHPDSAEYIWFCPESWGDACDEEGEFNPKAYFQLYWRDYDNSNSYFLADFCGVGQTDIGFQFDVTLEHFGGRGKWTKKCKSIPESLAAELGNMGFCKEKKGTYFLPVRLDPAQLARAWEDEDYAEAFKPIMDALDTIEKSQSTFEALMDHASP